MCIRIWYFSFSFWLTSLCIIGSRFIHLIRTDSNAFLIVAEWYSIVYLYHNFFIRSSVDGHLGCFRVLAIVNSAAMNNGIHVSFSTLVSSGCMPRSGIAGDWWDMAGIWWSYSQFFKESPYHLPQWLYQFTFPPTVRECSLFSRTSLAFIVCRLFDDGHSDWCEVNASL